MYEAGVLGEEGFHRRGAETQSQAEPGTNQAGLGTKVREAEGGIFAGKITGCLASQARHEMGAPMELFAGAKRGREKSAKVRIVSRKCAKVHESSHRSGP